jgi:hypothetical protein
VLHFKNLDESSRGSIINSIIEMKVVECRFLIFDELITNDLNYKNFIEFKLVDL